MIGQIELDAGSTVPSGWALCDGQTLSISQNAALFSIIGTGYGGNGTSTFALPNLEGRLALGDDGGQSGEQGVESLPVDDSELPAVTPEPTALALMTLATAPTARVPAAAARAVQRWVTPAARRLGRRAPIPAPPGGTRTETAHGHLLAAVPVPGVRARSGQGSPLSGHGFDYGGVRRILDRSLSARAAHVEQARQARCGIMGRAGTGDGRVRAGRAETRHTVRRGGEPVARHARRGLTALARSQGLREAIPFRVPHGPRLEVIVVRN